MSFIDLLKRSTAPEGGAFAPMATGTYIATIDDVGISFNDSPPTGSLKFKIKEGEFAGRIVWRNWKLGDTGLGYFKKDINILGIDVEALSDEQALADQLYSVVNKTAEIYVKCVPKDSGDGQWENAYLNKLLAAGTPTAGAPAFAEEDELGF